jgi:hypothetical protein
MSAKIIPFPGITRLDSDPDLVLAGAVHELDTVILIGVHKDGTEYFASSIADGADALWLLERLKKQLLEMPDDHD